MKDFHLVKQIRLAVPLALVIAMMPTRGFDLPLIRSQLQLDDSRRGVILPDPVCTGRADPMPVVLIGHDPEKRVAISLSVDADRMGGASEKKSLAMPESTFVMTRLPSASASKVMPPNDGRTN